MNALRLIEIIFSLCMFLNIARVLFHGIINLAFVASSIAVIGVVVIMQIYVEEPVTSIAAIVLFASVATICWGKSISFIFIKSVFAFCFSKIIGLAGILLTFAVFALLGESKAELEIAIIKFIPQIVGMLMLTKWLEKKDFDVIVNYYSATIFMVAATMLLITYAISRRFYYIADRELRVYALIISIGLVCIIPILAYNDYSRQRRIEKEQQRRMQYEAQVDQLIEKAHKYKEIIPSIIRQLTVMLDESKGGMSSTVQSKMEQSVEDLLRLHGKSMAQARRELIAQQSFSSTGSALLDSQLLYEQEAAEMENIAFEIFVSDPISALEGGLGADQLQQVIGDLYRDAVAAIQRSDCGAGWMMLSMGRREGCYQIRFCDNGVPFPPRVLRELGRRGLTEGGTGHGYADILEVLAQVKGSLSVEEFTPGSRRSTKAITLCFDGLGRIAVQTYQDEVGSYEKALALVAAQNRHSHAGV